MPIVLEDQAQRPTRKFHRARLLEATAREIFKARPQRQEDGIFVPATATSKQLAAKYNVADKTVRDIWNRRNWTNVTRDLWSEAEIAAEEQQTDKAQSPSGVFPAQTRKRGRPLGACDTVRRKKSKLAKKSVKKAGNREEQIRDQRETASEKATESVLAGREPSTEAPTLCGARFPLLSMNESTHENESSEHCDLRTRVHEDEAAQQDLHLNNYMHGDQVSRAAHHAEEEEEEMEFVLYTQWKAALTCFDLSSMVSAEEVEEDAERNGYPELKR